MCIRGRGCEIRPTPIPVRGGALSALAFRPHKIALGLTFRQVQPNLAFPSQRVASVVQPQFHRDMACDPHPDITPSI